MNSTYLVPGSPFARGASELVSRANMNDTVMTDWSTSRLVRRNFIRRNFIQSLVEMFSWVRHRMPFKMASLPDKVPCGWLHRSFLVCPKLLGEGRKEKRKWPNGRQRGGLLIDAARWFGLSSHFCSPVGTLFHADRKHGRLRHLRQTVES